MQVVFRHSICLCIWIYKYIHDVRECGNKVFNLVVFFFSFNNIVDLVFSFAVIKAIFAFYSFLFSCCYCSPMHVFHSQHINQYLFSVIRLQMSQCEWIQWKKPSLQYKIIQNKQGDISQMLNNKMTELHMNKYLQFAN